MTTPFAFPFSPAAATSEWQDVQAKLSRGLSMLADLEADDVQVGACPREAVYRQDKMVLYRYTPTVPAEQRQPIPLLVVYALVNRPDMVDLQADRSLVRNLLAQGVDVYLIDWGYPTRADRYLTLDDYINGYIDGCVDYLRRAYDLPQVNLLGICQGGVFSLCYSSLHTDKIKNLVAMVAPVDFHVEADDQGGLLGCWMRDADIDLMVDTLGNMPGDLMNAGYLMLKPYALGVQKYVEMVDVLDDERKLLNFLRMEKWIFDSPDQAGEAFRAFNQQCYIENRLIQGTLKVGGATVDLGRLTMPVLNLYAEKDHLVPPASTQALGDYVGTDDYTVRGYPVGHIGMYVSGKVQKQLAPAIASWLETRA